VAHPSLRRVGLGVALLGGVVFAATLATRSRHGAPTAPASSPGTAARPSPAPETEEAKLDAMRHAAMAALATILRPEESDRARAVAMLRNLGPGALAFVRACFGEGADGPIGAAAAFALAQLGDDSDRQAVAGAFLDDQLHPTPLLALAAAELRDPALAAAFVGMRDSPDPEIRLAVARGLRAANDPPIEELLPLLSDPEPRVRDAAERAMVEVIPRADATAVRGVAETAFASADASLRIAALRLGASLDAPWVDELATRGVRDGDRSVRSEATTALGAVGTRAAAAPLLGLVERGADRAERVQAATALGTVDAPPETLDALARTASDGADPMVALAAARTLAAHRDPRAIPALVRLETVRESAELKIDDEDADLLEGLSRRILSSASSGRARERGESWSAWWQRVGKNYQFPTSATVPDFPWNH